jgi:hypothetical protein
LKAGGQGRRMKCGKNMPCKKIERNLKGFFLFFFLLFFSKGKKGGKGILTTARFLWLLGRWVQKLFFLRGSST